MKLLYYSPISSGGIARYAHEQANALVGLGAQVLFLTTHHHNPGQFTNYKVLPALKELWLSPSPRNKLLKNARYIHATLFNINQLIQTIQKHSFQYVLLGSYSEYLAPFWFKQLKQLADGGTVFGAVVHDPVRDFVVGPYWWHRWSVACGYSFLREAFVHEAIALDTARPMPHLRTTVIPHGPYPYLPAQRSKEELRQHFQLPVNAKVLLAFGHIRDNKNLDLVIRAIANLPDVYLLVAGQEQSDQQKPACYYQKLAEELGVGDRIRWHLNYIPDHEIPDFFTVTDLVLLTYSESFRSASGVLNIAVAFQKPCLVSSGKSNLRSTIENYNLGLWIEPDCSCAIQQGINVFLRNLVQANWHQYLMENSWKHNAELVIQSLSDRISPCLRLKP